MRISDWSSDVCSSDLDVTGAGIGLCLHRRVGYRPSDRRMGLLEVQLRLRRVLGVLASNDHAAWRGGVCSFMALVAGAGFEPRSVEHTSELQSLMRTSYAVFCLIKKHEDNTQSTINF